MIQATLLAELKELVEDRRTLEDWEHFRMLNQEAIQPLFSPRLLYLLKIRPLLAAPEVLIAHRIPFRQEQFQCRQCGGLLYRVIPGETLPEEIVALAAQSNFPERDRILKTKWMPAGQYCLKGCTTVYWNIPSPLTPEEEQLREQERLEADERGRREKARFEAICGQRTCPGCGNRLRVWADLARARCGYCLHPLDIPPDTDGT